MSISETKSTRETAKNKKANTAEKGIRLNVYLQERGLASRRKADELITRGLVAINGKVIKTLGTKVIPGMTVTVQGKVLDKALPHVTYLFYKPDLCITSRKDPEARPTIFDYPALRKLPPNVQAVGRLDFRSEGLLILTNDGDLAYALTHPKFSVEKRYACLVTDQITPDEIEKLRAGIDLEDGFAKPVSVRTGARENLGADKRGQWVEITVTEGRNRLVRRMLAALGHRVIKLVRTAIGETELPLKFKPADMIVAKGDQLDYLNKVKENFLSHHGISKPKKPRRTALSTYKKPKGLSPDLYAEEQARRSQELSRRATERKERLTKEPSKPKTYSAVPKRKTKY